ncbi:MAG: hypothetical protein R6V85_13390 [Polyangia bacterium]
MKNLLYDNITRLLLLAAISILGCETAGRVELVPILPDGRPDLLSELNVQSLTVRARPAGDNEADEKWRSVARGGSLSMPLPRGEWRVTVRGENASGRELVHGETLRFEVEAGKSRRVEFFLGETMAFNLVRLEPGDLAESLADREDHSATLLVDERGRPSILVAGGRSGENGDPLADALLIDPVERVVSRLPALSCPRASHTALSVETSSGTRVVLAGGEGGCSGDLDVFDPATQSFERINPCGNDAPRPAVAEIEVVGGETRHTGRVVVVGNPRCLVDVFEGESVSDASATDPGPDAPVTAAVNDEGQVLVVTHDRLFVDGAEKGESCAAGDAWKPEASWVGIEDRLGGRLVSLESQQFLFVGGELPGGGGSAAEHGWSLISLVRDCELGDVLEGPSEREILPATAFALIDIGSGSEVAMLVAGGRDPSGQISDRVSLLLRPAGASSLTAHDMSCSFRERPIRLRAARAGPAAVDLPDGTSWLIGGGDARPEAFVPGSGDISSSTRSFGLRKPALTTVAVLDSSGEGDQWFETLLGDLAERFTGALYSQAANYLTLLFLAANADLGLPDELLESDLAADDGCAHQSGPQMIAVASGYLEDLDVGGDVSIVHEFEGSSQLEDPRAKAVETIAEVTGMRNGCVWRQLLRVGFEGLLVTEDGDSTGEIDFATGIRLLLFAARDDDCSLGIYSDFDQVETELPGEDLLADWHCTASSGTAGEAFDEYFGLPPDGTLEPYLRERLEDVVWDERDLIAVAVGNTSEQETCSSPAYGELSRPTRLLETLEWIEQQGARLVKIDLCGAENDETLAAELVEMGQMIEARNPSQACVPGFVASNAPYDAQRGAYVPVLPEDDRAVEVTEAAIAHCRGAYVVSDSSSDDLYRKVVSIDTDRWWAGTDTDRRGGCEADDSGWMIRMSRDSSEQGTGESNAEFVCLP